MNAQGLMGIGHQLGYVPRSLTAKSVIDDAKQRLREVDAQLAAIPALEKEREQLQSILRSVGEFAGSDR